jgi:hypothetical protein
MDTSDYCIVVVRNLAKVNVRVRFSLVAQTEERRLLWRMAERSPLSRWDEKGTRLRLASQVLADQGCGRIKAVLNGI